VSLLPPLPEGQVRAAVRAPAGVLSAVSVEVDPLDPDVVALAADLLATQRAAPGCVGLAAPQVGVTFRVFSLDVTDHPKARICHGPLVLANPVVVQATRWERGREGCLSVPDLTGDVKRATRLVLRGVVPGTGEALEVTTSLNREVPRPTPGRGCDPGSRGSETPLGVIDQGDLLGKERLEFGEEGTPVCGRCGPRCLLRLGDEVDQFVEHGAEMSSELLLGGHVASGSA